MRAHEFCTVGTGPNARAYTEDTEVFITLGRTSRAYANHRCGTVRDLHPLHTVTIFEL